MEYKYEILSTCCAWDYISTDRNMVIKLLPFWIRFLINFFLVFFWYRKSALPDFATQFLDFEGKFSLFVKNIHDQKSSVYPLRKRSVNIAKCGILLTFSYGIRSYNPRFFVCFPDSELEFSFHSPTVFHHDEHAAGKQAVLLVFTAWLMPREQMVFCCFCGVFWSQNSVFLISWECIAGLRDAISWFRKRSVNIAKCGLFAYIRFRFLIVKSEVFRLFSWQWTQVFVPLSDSFPSCFARLDWLDVSNFSWASLGLLKIWQNSEAFEDLFTAVFSLQNSTKAIAKSKLLTFCLRKKTQSVFRTN